MKKIIWIILSFILATTVICAKEENMYKLPPRDKKEIKIIAHRGNSMFAPENTLVSYSQAIALGADIMETDLHITKDGVVVFLHDDLLDRTTNGTGNVADKNIDELKGYSAAYEDKFQSKYAGEPIPTLEDALTFFKKNKTKCLLEFKTPKAIKETARIIEKVKFPKKDVMLYVWNLSDSKEAFDTFKDKIPIYNLDPMGEYLKAENKEDFIKTQREAGIRGFSINFGAFFNASDADRSTLAILAAKYKMPIFIWTVDSSADINKCMEYQVKGTVGKKIYIGKIDGITTNDPAKALMLAGRNK